MQEHLWCAPIIEKLFIFAITRIDRSKGAVYTEIK